MTLSTVIEGTRAAVTENPAAAQVLFSTGPESPERYQQLAAAVDEHCPVLDLFRNPVPVDRTVTVH